MSSTMRAVTGALAIVALLGVAACSAAPSASTFTPEGGSTAASGAAAPASATAPAGYVMPAFGSNVHIDMTSWVPANAAEAAAVNADKSFQLAYLYAEYKGGRDSSWVNYVNSGAQATVQQSLQAKDVTGESFQGTIEYFDMSVTPDPVTSGGYDVLSCFDDAGAVNTNLTTGAVIPASSSPDSHYMRIADVLLKDAAGQWQVVSSFPTVYYPEASNCKP
jgi:hypothetical protein